MVLLGTGRHRDMGPTVNYALVLVLCSLYGIGMATNLTDIMSHKQMEIRQHYLGNHLHHHVHNQQDVITFHCKTLMTALTATINVTWPPPKEIPPHMKISFLMDGLVKEMSWYDAYRQNGADKPYEWSVETIEAFVRGNNTCGPFYQSPVCAEAMTKHRQKIIGQEGMVVGTMDPWSEAWLLKTGASKITTLEYHKIISHHPNLTSLHPSELPAVFNGGKRFDFIWTFSSIEHNGLGKWGDPVNPFGDLEDLARCHCMLKDDGILFLGVPVGRDEVVWNAHRIYGRYRISLALKNWRLIDYIGPAPFDNLETPGRWEDQPVIVLQKIPFVHEGRH